MRFRRGALVERRRCLTTSVLGASRRPVCARRWPPRSSGSSRRPRRQPRLVKRRVSLRRQSTVLPRIWSSDDARLAGRHADVACDGSRLPCFSPLTYRLPLSAEWPRKVRVGANSPELVANHGFRDVDRHVLATVVHGDGVAHHVGEDGCSKRDQVLMTFLSPAAFICNRRGSRRRGSTKGPFFKLLLTVYSLTRSGATSCDGG